MTAPRRDGWVEAWRRRLRRRACPAGGRQRRWSSALSTRPSTATNGQAMAQMYGPGVKVQRPRLRGVCGKVGGGHVADAHAPSRGWTIEPPSTPLMAMREGRAGLPEEDVRANGVQRGLRRARRVPLHGMGGSSSTTIPSPSRAGCARALVVPGLLFRPGAADEARGAPPRAAATWPKFRQGH